MKDNESTTITLRLSLDLLSWIEQQKDLDNRTRNNWIETRLMELKQKSESEGGRDD